MDLIDRRTVSAERPLRSHLDGEKDAAGNLTDPGFRQVVEARGVTPGHVHTTCKRVGDLLDACGFAFWSDLVAPGAEGRVEVYLGGRRAAKKISGRTLNYYVRDFQSFCRWLAKKTRAAVVPMAELAGVDNVDVDSQARRPLSVEEMRRLLDAAASAGVEQGLTGDERALLYRFAFETGIRPMQIRSLTVADFDLAADPPTVTTHARYVKRRREHTQILRPALAAELAKLFKNKLPAAPALKLPGRYHMADMLRADLAAARAAWIRAAPDDKQREERQRSDFLAAENHRGERAVFYSTRHGHGTALADAGVPEKDIAASMHHASRTTTARYLHTDRKAARAAIDAMPDLSSPQRHAATGTAGAEPEGPRLTIACPTGRSSAESGGLKRGGKVGSSDPDSAAETRETAKTPGETGSGLLAELADAMDSKSIVRKDVSVRLR